MKKYLNYPLLNLEHLFNLIEMDIFYSKSNKAKNIKNDFIRLICDVLTEKTPYPFTHNSSGHLSMNYNYKNYFNFLRLFIKDDKSGLKLYDDTIISFNYDLVLEGAACIYNWRRVESLGDKYILGNLRGLENLIKFNMHIDNKNIISDDVSKYYRKEREASYFPDSDIYSDKENSLKFIKLHGSINWKSVNNGKSFIVPPTWNKSDIRIRNLWDKAYRELIQARRIIIVGYSFPETDIYVKSLLALALNENRILQNIYFINPDKDTAKKLSLSMLDKHFEKYCSYQEWHFSEFITRDDGKNFIKNELNRNI
jgi:hypothetical protein